MEGCGRLSELLRYTPRSSAVKKTSKSDCGSVIVILKLDALPTLRGSETLVDCQLHDGLRAMTSVSHLAFVSMSSSFIRGTTYAGASRSSEAPASIVYMYVVLSIFSAPVRVEALAISSSREDHDALPMRAHAVILEIVNQS